MTKVDEGSRVEGGSEDSPPSGAAGTLLHRSPGPLSSSLLQPLNSHSSHLHPGTFRHFRHVSEHLSQRFICQLDRISFKGSLGNIRAVSCEIVWQDKCLLGGTSTNILRMLVEVPLETRILQPSHRNCRKLCTFLTFHLEYINLKSWK